MLESWPISRRVYVGFLVLTTMVVGLALFSHSSVKTLGAGYSDYRESAAQTVAITAYVEDLFEARLGVYQFRGAPTDETISKVTENIDRMINSSERLAKFENSPQRLAEVRQLISLAEEYKNSFLEAVGFLQTASQTKSEILAQAAQIETAATNLFTTSVDLGSREGITSTAGILQLFLTSKIDTKQFFLTGQPQDLQLAQEKFAAIDVELNDLASLNLRGDVAAAIDALRTSMDGYENALNAYGDAVGQANEITASALANIGPEIQHRFDDVVVDVVNQQTDLGSDGDTIVSRLSLVIPTTGIAATIVAILAAWAVGHWISVSVRRLAQTTTRLANGDRDVEIEGAEHPHELGHMARALSVFRDAQREAEDARSEQIALQDSQRDVVATMQAELAHLADGDLTANIDRQFDPQYEELRSNFNDAIVALQRAMAKVSETSSIIRSTATEANTSTTELSQRTENQAATLEETAAALEQLTTSVRSAAEHAKSVDTSVHKARSEAERNGEIVAQAVNAMDAIAKSSKQITQVTGVIDDIAFQTNLLALNAGVEAARAGESGKGFAVVASEVRALAQKSADAAKEISGLIASSSKHVEQGTELVGNAGEALTEIIKQVNDIASMISQIASSSEEQAVGLSEINSGVNQLDQVTQQNAAMVQESLSRGDALARETQKLNELISNFKIDQYEAEPPATFKTHNDLAVAIDSTVTNQPTSAAPVVKEAAHQVAPQRRAVGNGADEPIWEDF